MASRTLSLNLPRARWLANLEAVNDCLHHYLPEMTKNNLEISSFSKHKANTDERAEKSRNFVPQQTHSEYWRACELWRHARKVARRNHPDWSHEMKNFKSYLRCNKTPPGCKIWHRRSEECGERIVKLSVASTEIKKEHRSWTVLSTLWW